MVVIQRFEHVNGCAGQEGVIDFKRWIFGGCTDKRDKTAFDVRQKGVLLAFVEPVDFIDKKDRSSSGIRTDQAGAFNGIADVLDAGKNR